MQVRFRDHLGDVGDCPQEVLEPVLGCCSAANLAAIDYETRQVLLDCLSAQACSTHECAAWHAGLPGDATWTSQLTGTAASSRILARQPGHQRCGGCQVQGQLYNSTRAHLNTAAGSKLGGSLSGAPGTVGREARSHGPAAATGMGPCRGQACRAHSAGAMLQC